MHYMHCAIQIRALLLSSNSLLHTSIQIQYNCRPKDV